MDSIPYPCFRPEGRILGRIFHTKKTGGKHHEKEQKNSALAAAAALCLAILAGCGTGQNTLSSSDEPGGAEKNVILVVSFGTSYNDSRDKTIGAVEDAIAAAYPDYEVRRAFTSQTIIDILAEREGLEIDNVE